MNMPGAFKWTTPDTFAETTDGASAVDGLIDALWACVPDYDTINREDCGPADVIGANAIALFWDRFSDEHKAAMIELQAAADAEYEAWRAGQ